MSNLWTKPIRVPCNTEYKSSPTMKIAGVNSWTKKKKTGVQNLSDSKHLVQRTTSQYIIWAIKLNVMKKKKTIYYAYVNF